MNKQQQQWQAFKIDYTEQANRHWLTLHKEGMRADDLDELDLKMLLQNKQQGMLEMRLVETNAQIKLQYDYTNMRRLGRNAQKEMLSPSHIRQIMLAAVDVLEHSTDLFLHASKVILDPTLIFLDRNTGEIQFLYMPLKQPLYPAGAEGRTKQWKALLDYLEQAAAEEHGGQFEYWRRYLRHQHFHLGGWRQVILEEETVTTPTSAPSSGQQDSGNLARRQPEKPDSLYTNNRNNSDRSTVESRPRPVATKVPPASEGINQQLETAVPSFNIPGEQAEEKPDTNASNRIIWIGAGYVLLSIPIWRVYLAKSDMDGALWTAIGASGILTVLAIWLMIKYRKRQEQDGVGEDRHSENHIDWIDWPLPTSEPSVQPTTEAERARPVAVASQPSAEASHAQPAKSNQIWRDYVKTMEDEGEEQTAAYYAGLNERTALLHSDQATVMLGQATARLNEEPRLESWIEWQEPGQQTTSRYVLVTGQTITVGREEREYAICLSGVQVSRQHCELTQVEGQWQVTDMSSNGTLLNGEKMIPYKAYPLQNQDCLRIYQYELHMIQGRSFKSQAG